MNRPRARDPRLDATLVKRIASGDRAALAELYDCYAPPAYSLAARLVGPAAAEDVVHDAFVALVDRSASFDASVGTFRGWFLTSIHHRCLSQLRTRGRATDPGAMTDVPDPDPDPADEIVRQLQDEAVRGALLQLVPAQREALVLAYYGGFSQSALAERLGVPLGTVKARMRRGLIALRGLLRGEAIQSENNREPEEAP